MRFGIQEENVQPTRSPPPSTSDSAPTPTPVPQSEPIKSPSAEVPEMDPSNPRAVPTTEVAGDKSQVQPEPGYPDLTRIAQSLLAQLEE